MNENIKAAAKEIFERYPLAKKVFITTDEQGFLSEDRARLHDKDFTTVKRSDVMEEKKEKNGAKPEKKSAEELIAFATTATIEELEAIIATGEKRATVIAAFDARKAELTAN